MDPELFLTDIERKPEVLARAVDAWQRENPWSAITELRDFHGTVVLLGMGSSHYANALLAQRLIHRGVNAVAVLASSDLLPRISPNDVVIAVSATGGSVETLDAVKRVQGDAPIVAVTNTEGSALTEVADVCVPMLAEKEVGGVACRSYQHTVALHLLLEHYLTGQGDPLGAARGAVTACADLLERKDEWFPRAYELLLGPDITAAVAPARRFASAQQSSLMFREGPRRIAVGCETGDWSHVDVYLTKTTDYRMLLFTGSQWEPQLMDWCTQRGSTVVSVGAEVPGAAMTIRYRGDDGGFGCDDVALLSEVTIAELIAGTAWAELAHPERRTGAS